MVLRSKAFLVFGLLVVALGPVAAQEESSSPVVMAENGKIRFQWRDPAARSVQVAGSFNNWDPLAFALARAADGIWRGELILAEGRHEYKFVINGDWEQGDNRRVTLARGTGGILQILPDLPTFNTPYNSRLYFSGRLHGRAVLRNVLEGERADTGRTRFTEPEIELMPSVIFTAGDKVQGYLGVGINPIEGRATVRMMEAEAALTENWGRLSFFRRRRVVEFNHPARFLDRFRHTLDDQVYFTNEERPPAHWFGRRFDVIRRSAADDEQFVSQDGWRGISGSFERGHWQTTAFLADAMDNTSDLWGIRTQWSGDIFRIGTTYVRHELARGVLAEVTPFTGLQPQTVVFTDTDGGFVQREGRTLNYDALAVLQPYGHNRDEWLGVDMRLGGETRNLFVELSSRRKDWSFVAFEDGDGVNPGNTQYYSPNFGENIGGYLMGGREDELGVQLGAVYFPLPRLGFELSYRWDDGTALTFDRDRRLVEVRPSGGSLTARARYQGRAFSYGGEIVRRTVRDFPNTMFQADFDNSNFTDLGVLGANDMLHFKQDLGLHLGRWGLTAGHRYRRYDLDGFSSLESNEIRAVIAYDFTERLSLSLSGRIKSYDLPNNTLHTNRPDRNEVFYSSGLGLNYRLSRWVRINLGIGVDADHDEDVEEGRLFFLREALARARRATPGGAAIHSHVLDQVIEAERILARERRMELTIDARF